MKSLLRLIKVANVYLGSFWYGYTLPRKVLRTDFPIAELLETLGCKRKRNGLSIEDLRRVTQRAAKRFCFHKSRPCLSGSLILFHYMKCYGFHPVFVLGTDFESELYYSSHCWIIDGEDPGEHVFHGYAIISRQNHLILLKKNSELINGPQKPAPFQTTTSTLRSREGTNPKKH